MSKELSAPELKDLVARGSKRGSLSSREIMDALQDVELTPDQIEDVLDTLDESGVDIVDVPDEGPVSLPSTGRQRRTTPRWT